MRRSLRLVVLALAGIPSAAVAHAPPAAPASIAGLGEVTPPGCEVGAYKVPFSAVSDAGEVWIVGRPAALGVACDGLVYGTGQVFAGSWHPETGGCIAEVSGSTARICIGPAPHRGISDEVAFRLCPDVSRCFFGEARIVRA